MFYIYLLSVFQASFVVHSKGGEDKKTRQLAPGRLIEVICHLSIANCLLPIANYICEMEVNDAMIDKLAHLARLKFNDAEKQEIKTDLQRMIVFVEKLNELDLEGVEPLLHMSEEVNVLREDEVKGSVSRTEALKNAPSHDEQFFKVPKVIKK